MGLPGGYKGLGANCQEKGKSHQKGIMGQHKGSWRWVALEQHPKPR